MSSHDALHTLDRSHVLMPGLPDASLNEAVADPVPEGPGAVSRIERPVITVRGAGGRADQRTQEPNFYMLV